VTRFIFHYDLEDSDLWLKAAPRLRDLHEQYETPATFLMLGRVLEQKGKELREIFPDSPLFDIQSHTYGHRMLKDSRMHGPGISVDQVREEIALGKRWVEEVFERPCVGVRAGCGFYRGMQGEVERLRVIAECGIRYISTDLRGPADSIPSGLQQAYWYDEEGQPDLLELPGHGWHDNVLKNQGGRPFLALPWPSFVPWGIPNRPPRTPEEEFAVQRVWIDRAREQGLDFISLVYHPHSIYRMSPECATTRLLLEYVTSEGIPTTTYTDLYRHYARDPHSVPPRNFWTDAPPDETFRVGPGSDRSHP